MRASALRKDTEMHEMSILHIFVYVLLLGLANADVSIELNDDVLGLIVFKSDLQNPPALSSWTEDDASPCSWKYIQCNPSTGRVTELSLSSLGLSGRLGKGLEKLQGLRVLALSNNNLTGDISTELTHLTNLETLDLSHNKFSGQVLFSSSKMTSSLSSLDLSNNLLSGSLPDDIFQGFTSLRYLSLAGNSFEGPIPRSLSKCGTLGGLNLSNNHFSGNPFGNSNDGIWSLKKLRLLDLSNNYLSGSVPNGIFSLHNIKELHLQGNQFSGTVPFDMGLCPHMIKVDLSNNIFTGEVPATFSKLTSLAFLNLANNQLSGKFPQWIGSLASLEHLDMSSNGITGSLPISLGDLKSLKDLILSKNKITGTIPTSLVYCTALKNLQLSGNSLSGSIPEGLFSLSLEEMDLSQNGLTGSIPPGSGQLFASLLVLDLSSNDLKGDIPAEVGLFSRLNYLNLSWNSLHSRIPPEVGYIQNLTVLDLRQSDLYGMIPGELCDSTRNLAVLQLDGNSLGGPIPEEIGNCSSLYMLSLSHNKLSGPIPSSMSMLKKLQILRLEANGLSGEMPKELGTLENLLAVNVSYNKLIGRLPPGGIFPSLDASALRGNIGLCSPLLKGPCKLNVQKPLVLDPYEFPHQVHGNNNQGDNNKAAQGSNHHRFLSISAIVAMSAALIIIAGVLIITLLNANARRKLAFIDNALESIFSSSSRSGTPSVGRLVLFDSRSSGNLFANPEDLINKAAEIGGGVFGTVYKASLGAEGRVVAVKKLLTSNILQYPEDFDREARLLGKVRHPNVASLRGYYWTPQLQLLVSDFAPNGSLQFMLHDRPSNIRPLLWPTRIKILLGTAKGLAHLHSCRPPIIHYNLKPSNILLDENCNAKISDFGLARLLTKLDRHIAGNRFQGAPGYAAPELACQSLRINEKCDVYGFGVMALEIVTGRRPIECGEDNVMILNDHVRVLLEEGNALDCVDHNMGEYPDEEVLPVLKLALVCTSQIPSSRPSMSEVVQVLQVIRTPVTHRMEAY